MIVIYKLNDLTERGKTDLAFYQPPPMFGTIDPDLETAASYAETVYFERPNGSFQMVKARNAPLDPFRVSIKIERSIKF